jgi:hypothetical protein
LVYSTYFGGSGGASGGDNGNAIAVDSLGNAYVTGRTSSTDFPTTPGAFQTTYAGGFTDAFVFQLNPAGSARVYSTYLGGTDEDAGHGIAVDSSGNAHVTGHTYSADFPTTLAAFQTTYGGNADAFVTKLNPAGSAPLIYSTFLGGSGLEYGRGIAVGSLGNAYVAGQTDSINFPVTVGAFQTTSAGGTHAFVTKLNLTGSAPLDYSTYLGGTGPDYGFGIAVDSSGSAYVTGLTSSTNFPTTVGAFQTTFAGGIAPGGTDAFVTKFNPAGSAPLVYSTYLGGSSDDFGQSIALDSAGNAWVTGYTLSANFPTTAGAFQPTYAGGPVDAFVTKLNPAGSAPLVYSSYLGGSLNDFGTGIAVDIFGNAYATGYTQSTNFPTTAGAFQTTYGGNTDGYVTKIAEVNLEECPPSGQGDCEQSQGGGEVDDNDNGNQGQGDFSCIARRPSTTGNISGDLQYLSPANATRLQSVAITSLTTIGNTATLAGTCTDNGVPCTFVANVTDSGPIGAGDIFTISISGGPVRGGTLRSGKIQVRPR